MEETNKANTDADVAHPQTEQSQTSTSDPALDTSKHTITDEAKTEQDDSSLESPVEKPADADPAAAAAANPAAAAPLKDFEKEPIGKRAVVMLALCMAVFLAALDVTIIATPAPTIVEHFHAPGGYTWIGSAFMLANAASVPTWGKVSEIFGRKPALLAANFTFLIGSLVAGLSDSMGMLIAGRAVQGVGAGGLIVLVNIVIGDLFSLRNRGAYYGIIGGVWAIASAIGPIIGGAFTEEVSWRWCFYVNLPLDGTAFLIILFFLDLKTPKTPIVQGLKAIDWLGSLLVIGGTLMFLFGLNYGGDAHPWDSAIVLCLIIFGIVTWALFIVVEWKVAKYPVIPLSIFKTRSVAICYAVVFLHGFTFIAGSYYLPLYFQACLNSSPLHSGVLLLPTCLALSVGSIGVGILIRKTGRYLEAMYFGFFMMTLGNGLLINLDAESSLAKIIIYQIILGLGIGPLFQSPLIALQAHVKPRDMAPATATLGFIRQLSTSMSVVIGGVIYSNEVKKHRGQLTNALGPQIAGELSGEGAGANINVIHNLPQPGKTIAENAFADSFSKMWILYTVLPFIGLVIMPLLAKKVLTKDYAENKTGLDAEREKAAERKQEEQERIALKRERQAAKGKRRSSAGIDIEKGSPVGSPVPAAGKTGTTTVEEDGTAKA